MESEFHVGDDAELYAAGALTEEEQAAVDAHVARCDACLRRLGEAEETVLALERVNAVRSSGSGEAKVLPFQRRGVSSWWVAVAAAAALILGFILPHRGSQSDTPTIAMLHSHFAHAQFTGAGPVAKVLYARDRAWYYVIVAGAHRYEVYGVRDGQNADLGTTQPGAQTSDLFAPSARRFDRVELRDAGKIVETAAIR
jgi:hypothetical protein